jgi:hypothetical protein
MIIRAEVILEEKSRYRDVDMVDTSLNTLNAMIFYYHLYLSITDNPACPLRYSKREEMADMKGKVCLVTGTNAVLS